MSRIVFSCPECGEEMDIAPRMAGQEIDCIECGAPVEVPVESEERGPGKRRRKNDPGLSSNEWLLFTLLFLAIPAVNVIASSVLYYVWKGDQPKRANQINLLGFLVFGVHVIALVLILVLLPMLLSRR